MLKTIRCLMATAAAAILLTTMAPKSLKADVGTWSLLNAPFSGGLHAGTMVQLMDGTILVQGGGNSSGLPAPWKRLKPNSLGNYLKGTWSAETNMLESKLYFIAMTLPDGRLMVAGGEYTSGNSESNEVEIYDPMVNTWTVVPSPPGWNNIGDASCVLLPNGKVFIGSIFDKRTVLFDPVSHTWIPGGSLLDPAKSSSESSWHLMSDGTVVTLLTHGPDPQTAQKYDYKTNQWYPASALTTGIAIVNNAIGFEIGPEFLLPNGKLMAFGANGHNAVYTKGTTLASPGSWKQVADLPSTGDGIQGMVDAPGAIMPNMKILISTGPVKDGNFYGPVSFYEYDYTKDTYTPVPAPPANSSGVPYTGNMLVAPTGQVFYSTTYDASINVYNMAAFRATNTGKPVISSVVLNPDNSYLLTGTGLNGISFGAVYGDEATSFTNFPLVRLSNPANGKVWYARAYGRNFCGIATGSKAITTRFDLPSGLDAGTLKLSVVANGIASDPIDFLPSTPTGINIACGSTTKLGVYIADKYATGGVTGKPNSVGLADMSAVAIPAPHAVYLSDRSGASFSYRVTGLAKSTPYNVTLHFTEDRYTATGQRTFNVKANGAAALTNFDIFSVAKAQHKAVAKSFKVTSDATGVIKLDFVGTKGDAKVNAIQLSK